MLVEGVPVGIWDKNSFEFKDWKVIVVVNPSSVNLIDDAMSTYLREILMSDQLGLDEVPQKYKDEIVEFFMSIKDKVRIKDLTFYG
jgi:hypothetical protein